MSRFDNDDELKNFLKDSAPVAPPAKPEALQKAMAAAGVAGPTRSKRRLPAYIVSAVAASVVAVVGLSVGVNLPKPNGPAVTAQSPEAESYWEAIEEDDDADEMATLDVGSDFLLLAFDEEEH